jgi:signal transduction histidine kinase
MSVMHRAPCGYLVFDDGQVIRDVNVEGAASLEYQPDELLDKPLGTILSAEVRMFFSAYAFPLLAETGRADEIYVSMRKRSGQDLPVLLNMSRWTSADGGLNEGVFLPIRRRHIFERELAQAHEREAKAQAATQRAIADAERLASGLELSERLAALGLMAAGIAHEINNPLTYVMGNLDMIGAELARHRLLGLEEAVACVREAQLGVERIGKLVAGLRMFSRVEPDRRAPVDLGKVVEMSVRMVSHEILRKGRLEVTIEPPAPQVLGDEARVGQVVMNLLVNAAQALPQEAATENRVTVTVGVRDTRAVVEVADNGPGVPAEIRDRIFDPFFTTKPVGVGTGLGLSVCHSIVTSMGGSVVLESPPAGGARFRVSLPLLAPQLRSPLPSAGEG